MNEIIKLKKCKNCHIEKDFSLFGQNPSGKYYVFCKECIEKRKNVIRLRECNYCKIEKPISEFHVDSGGSIYYKSCEKCFQERIKLKQVKTKVCTHCKQEKLMSKFPEKPAGNGRHYQCDKCYEKYSQLIKEREDLRLKGLKQCSRCKEIKLTDNFYNANTKNGKNVACKECVDLINKQWVNANIEKNNLKLRKWRLRNKEKLSFIRRKRQCQHRLKDLATSANRRAKNKGIEGKLNYLQLFNLAKKQKLKCAISGIKLTNQNISVDHKKPYADKGINSIDNIQLLDIKVNIMKSSYSEEDFLKLIETIYHHQQSKKEYNKISGEAFNSPAQSSFP